MRISLTLALDITRDTGDEPDEPGDISGAGSLTEHASHDSTPRLLGFQPDPQEHA